MTNIIKPAGTPVTALKPAELAAGTTTKVLVLAVHLDAAGAIVITPIDVEHEQDDQSELTAVEIGKRVSLREAYLTEEVGFKKGLTALFQMFDQRLCRAQFRSFENFCFALFGMHRIAEATVTKAKARVKMLKAELEAQT